MKTKLKILFLLIFTAAFLFMAVSINSQESSPDREKWYFEQWNYPYGAVLPQNMVKNLWRSVYALPNETALDNQPPNSWRLIGPYGSTVQSSNAKFSGRILDIEVGNSVNPIVATASGGLWTYFGFLPVSISDNLTSLVCGAFTTDPLDASRILLGTGEPSVRNGTGLYRSTNSGASWVEIELEDSPSGFYKIQHQGFITSFVHLASNTGYYRSTNNGLNWVRTLSGNITDFDFHPSTPSTIYCCKKTDGIYKSTNAGVNWVKVTTPGMPTTNVGRSSISVGISNSSRVAVNMSKSSDDNMHGIYLSENDGATWSNLSPPENIHGNQGWYNNMIGICPTNSNIIIAGGVTLWRTVNFGSSWTEVADPDVHADQHTMEWSSDGNSVYLGNDGGLAVSTNQGSTFSTLTNYFPVTQYVNFDIGVSNRGVIYGGSQDNGITGTTNGGETWLFTMGGDGGGVAVDHFSALNIYVTRGVLSGNWAFRRYKSTDKGLTWNGIDNGIDPSEQWYTKIRSNRSSPLVLYHNSGSYVYTSVNEGDNWTKLNNISFPAGVSNIDVTKNVGGNTVVYASLNSSITGQRLRVYDGGSFAERSSGLPLNKLVRSVATHINNNTTAYALINGFSSGEKIYRTTNRGVNWANITGDLPDVPLGDMVAHPSNINNLYLGTQMGCYRTTNAGVNWHRWNNGMPDAAIVTEMKWIDSTVENGRFYVVAATYGRSIFVRDISGDDPIGITNISGDIPTRYSLSQNYPNPFNPVTKIRFDIPAGSGSQSVNVKLIIYDALGREVRKLTNQNLKPGRYEVDWDASSYTSGIYFYKLETGNFRDTKKMLLVK
jgi:photosystem II stability/assembly factor-like uncharacterized protein